MKIATVTANLPTGKVLYVAFKGTSYILDFLNWNLELNHAMTQDPDFFVHRRAAGTLHAASFLLEHGLLQRLKDARENGVRRVVFTGHSLGGMYAALTFYTCFGRSWTELRRMLCPFCPVSTHGASLLALRWFSVAARAGTAEGATGGISTTPHLRQLSFVEASYRGWMLRMRGIVRMSTRTMMRNRMAN